MTTFLGALMSVGLLVLGTAIQTKLIHLNPVVGMIMMAFGGLCLLGTIVETLEDRLLKPQPLPAPLPKNRKRRGLSDPG